jgi:GxxExxY protein
MQEEYKHREITEKVIGCAMTVHNYLGPGFPEIIYERCLVIELERNGLRCISQLERDIYFQGVFVGKRRLDVLVEGKVLLELKALAIMENHCYNKILNYLKVFGFEVGLLLNFGSERLQFRRVALSKKSAKS